MHRDVGSAGRPTTRNCERVALACSCQLLTIFADIVLPNATCSSRFHCNAPPLALAVILIDDSGCSCTQKCPLELDSLLHHVGIVSACGVLAKRILRMCRVRIIKLVHVHRACCCCRRQKSTQQQAVEASLLQRRRCLSI